jgi:hypothetical protein
MDNKKKIVDSQKLNVRLMLKSGKKLKPTNTSIKNKALLLLFTVAFFIILAAVLLWKFL